MTSELQIVPLTYVVGAIKIFFKSWEKALRLLHPERTKTEDIEVAIATKVGQSMSWSSLEVISKKIIYFRRPKTEILNIAGREFSIPNLSVIGVT